MRISIRDLIFSYRAFTLRIEHLELAGARVTAVVGPNGAGKSTLLKCLASALPPARRTIFIDGRDLAAISPKGRALIVGYVPQEPAFTFNYSVLDFVLTGRAASIPAFSSPAAHDIDAAREALRYVGLADFDDRPYFELSSGERRLVLIARTLAQPTSVLLLDEPTTFLDPRHEVQIMELIRRLATEMKKTVIVTLHALDMALKYSDEMVFMKDGGVVASGPPQDILDESLLRSVYDIDMGILDVEGRPVILR